VAGWACAVGVDGWRLMTTTDPAERLALVAMTVRAARARAEMDPWTDTKGG
jgi:hypothetical protein